MAEPVRVLRDRDSGGSLLDEESCGGFVERLRERSDGRFELVHFPLTPERFLDPDLEERMVQGGAHNLAISLLQALLLHYFRSEKGTLVFSDVQLRLGPGLPSPVPDLWIVRGHPRPSLKIRSYDLAREKVLPCLIVEIVSEAAALRRVDQVDKVKLYEKVGVRDYLMAELPRPATGDRFRLLGLRLGPDGRYQPMQANQKGYLLSEATGLWFGAPPEGDRIEVFDDRTGERLRTLTDAEAEIERLREEIEELKKSQRHPGSGL